MSGAQQRQSRARFFSLPVFGKATVVLKRKVSQRSTHHGKRIIEFQLNMS